VIEGRRVDVGAGCHGLFLATGEYGFSRMKRSGGEHEQEHGNRNGVTLGTDCCWRGGSCGRFTW